MAAPISRSLWHAAARSPLSRPSARPRLPASLRPRRPQRRLESTKPETNTTAKPNGNPNNSPPPPPPPPSDRHRARVERLLAASRRFLPSFLSSRLERPLSGLARAPASHVLAFLVLHEATAVAPLVGLVALFKYAGWVPTAYVLGPWAAWAEEGARRWGRYARRKGWFGLGGRGEGDGEVELERELGAAAAEGREGRENKGGWFARMTGRGAKQDQRQAEEGGGSAASTAAAAAVPADGVTGAVIAESAAAPADAEEKSAEDGKTTTRKAWHKVRKAVERAGGGGAAAEAGYNTGIQIAAAYAITKLLFPARIALSLWATPWGARVLSRAWGFVRRRPRAP